MEKEKNTTKTLNEMLEEYKKAANKIEKLTKQIENSPYEWTKIISENWLFTKEPAGTEKIVDIENVKALYRDLKNRDAWIVNTWGEDAGYSYKDFLIKGETTAKFTAKKRTKKQIEEDWDNNESGGWDAS